MPSGFKIVYCMILGEESGFFVFRLSDTSIWVDPETFKGALVWSETKTTKIYEESAGRFIG